MKAIRLLSKIIMLSLVSLMGFAQDRVITGLVTDGVSGSGIPGVSILLKNSARGVTSDASGNFKIAVADENGVLVFSSVGYTTQQVSINSRSIINIALSPDTKSLDEVVVVGYGTQKKANVTGSMANFNAKDLDQRPVARVDQALIGQLAGVSVKQTSGTPGKGFSVQVRGSGSISASNEPLYVIDGFPLETSGQNASGGFSTGNPLDNLNPNDIENIQVLKDASSAAIYGSRAANGVVLITTKKGQDSKAKISLNVYSGITKATRMLDMLNAEEWIDRATEMINAQWVASGTGRTASQTTAERRAILKLAGTAVNTSLMLDDRWTQEGHPGLTYIDWQKEAFRTGMVKNYQLSASGGNANVKYYVSGNLLNQDGTTLNTFYKNYSARANVEVKANEKLKFGINLAPSYSEANDPGIEGKDAIIHIVAGMTPVQEANAGLDANTGAFPSYAWSVSRNSPIRQLENNVGLTKNFRTLFSTYVDYELLKGLTFRSSINFDNTDASTKRYSPDWVNGSQTARLNTPGISTSGSFSTLRKQTIVNENTLSYNTTIAKDHDLSTVIGYAYNLTKLATSTMSSAGGFNSSTITTLNAAASVTGNTNETQNVLLSYFGRVQYGFKGKYLLSASLRRDGSSRFGDNNKWGLFPSASVGWRLSEEDFMKNVSAVSELKLRASWGQAGNYNIGDYSSIATLGFANYTFGAAQVGGQSPNRISNPDLTWEKSQTIDVGVDVGFLKNRFTAAFDYYTKKNTDLLLNVPVPLATGFATSLTNIGEVLNQGWEFELTSRNINQGAFQWTTSVNLSHNENKVVHLAPGDAQIYIPSSFDIPHSVLKVGDPMYAFYVVKMTGILSQADIDNKVALYGTQTAGDPKYFDANNDGKIDANDRVYAGKPNPDLIYGITNTLKYKGFDLSVLVQGQTGGSVYSLFGRAVDRTGQGYTDNALGIYRNRWRSAENPGEGLRGKAYSTFGRIKNTDWLWSSDYWRIRNITVGYDLGKIVSKKYLQGARIYATAENWFGADQYKGGWNPDAINTNLSGDASFPQGGDYGGLPLARSIIFGVNLTF
ncbi:TonB-linked SusC/RagA family outer membrane protein [Arcicella aurantiaca]|uniref:TonB-linked SusC/RagA family outer membrane protein n=1 Tax=Arcicella aurantiaca TaxID=591202 RepID=A0A316EDF4_9BACT|nr:TonB-dependent receptor [Arcicella aurantiaca]PWK27410.1 TonB-linked SusC/RagA family outer membrane protein [Arcicella aurantiaca]